MEIKMSDRERELLHGMKIGTENEVVKNRFSGKEATLCPEAVAIYDIIMGCELVLNRACTLTGGGIKWPDSYEHTIELFYAARDVFINNWPNEYIILLD